MHAVRLPEMKNKMFERLAPRSGNCEKIVNKPNLKIA